MLLLNQGSRDEEQLTNASIFQCSHLITFSLRTEAIFYVQYILITSEHFQSFCYNNSILHESPNQIETQIVKG